MTVTSETDRIVYLCDGVAVEFAIPFRFLDERHIRAELSDPAEDAAVPWRLGVDHTLLGAGGEQGGRLRAAQGAPPAGKRLAIWRDVPLTQETDYRENDPFPAETHERALDKLTMIAQRQAGDVARALRLRAGDPDGGGAFDARGNRIANLDAPAADGDAVSRAFVAGQIGALIPQLPSFNPRRWSFATDGSAAHWPLPGVEADSPEMFIVTLDGVMQTPSSDYTIDLALERIVFSAVPPANLEGTVRQLAWPLGLGDAAIVKAKGGAIGRTLAEHLGAVVDVADFGARGDGAHDDLPPIQAAIAHAKARGGGVVRLGRGTYAVGGTVLLPSGVWLAGQGPGATRLRLRDAVDADLVKTEWADALWAPTGTAQAATAGSITLAAGASAIGDLYRNAKVSITGGVGAGQTRRIVAYNGLTRVATIDPAAPWGVVPNGSSTYAILDAPRGQSRFGLRDLTLDGNKANNAHGAGLVTYGRAFRIDNLRIENCKEQGWRSKWAAAAAGWDDDVATHDPEIEAIATRLVVAYCDREGIDFDGPHDSQFANVLVEMCSWASPGAHSGVRIGRGAGGTMMVNVHPWGDHKHAFEIRGDAVQCLGCSADTARDALVFVGGSWFEWKGGHCLQYVADPPTPFQQGLKGFVFGDATSQPFFYRVDCRMVDVPGGAVHFQNPGGSGEVRVHGSLQAALRSGSYGAFNAGHVTDRVYVDVAGAETYAQVDVQPVDKRVEGFERSPALTVRTTASGAAARFPQIAVELFGDAGGAPLVELASAKGTLWAAASVPAAHTLGSVNFKGHDGTGWRVGARLKAATAAGYSPTERSARLGFETADGDVIADRLWLEKNGDLAPAADNAQCLGRGGSPAFRWSEVWAASGTIQTSDAREKLGVAPLDSKALAFLRRLQPVTFQWKAGRNAVVGADAEGRPVVEPVAGKRIHVGLLAQQVEGAMRESGVDWALWGREDRADPESRQWLRYDQLIPVLVAGLQHALAEIDALRGAREGA